MPAPGREVRWSALRLMALAFGLLILAAAAYHAAALTAYRDSAGAGDIGRRLDSARLASSLEPWEQRYSWRVATLEGRTLFDRGKVLEAYRLLEPLSDTVRGDETYRTTYQLIARAAWPLYARRAHQAHAKDPAAPWPSGTTK